MTTSRKKRLPRLDCGDRVRHYQTEQLGVIVTNLGLQCLVKWDGGEGVHCVGVFNLRHEPDDATIAARAAKIREGWSAVRWRQAAGVSEDVAPVDMAEYSTHSERKRTYIAAI